MYTIRQEVNGKTGQLNIGWSHERKLIVASVAVVKTAAQLNLPNRLYKFLYTNMASAAVDMSGIGFRIPAHIFHAITREIFSGRKKDRAIARVTPVTPLVVTPEGVQFLSRPSF
ncbi:MAG: hypothetical protein ABIL58_27415 [Pseudomonadota bacterium]